MANTCYLNPNDVASLFYNKWSIYQLDDGVYYQTHRESQPLVNSFQTILFKDDPIFLILGIAGLIMAVIKRDLLVLFWIIPFFLFFYIIGWVSLYHWIPFNTSIFNCYRSHDR